MTIGIPKEIKEQEQRVGLLPSAAQTLVGHGHTVLVQKNAGVGSGYPDEEYVKAGAQIVESAKEIFQRADMIVKVKEPLPAEWPLLRRGQILFTYLHLAASKPLTEALLNSGVTGLAYETIQIGNRLPLLEPMSEIAGRMSVVMGAYYLAKHNGGTGVLLGGVPGVLPGRVVVLGGGTAGVNAGGVVVDVAIDRGGCADTSRPTTHLDPVYIEEGVTHYCEANMPAAYARTATQALTNITSRYVELLADRGLEGACNKQPALLGGVNTRDGKLTIQAVAEAHDLAYAPTFSSDALGSLGG